MHHCPSTWALDDVAVLDHLPEPDVAVRAAVETALLVALLLDAPPAPLPLAAAAALVALRPLRPPSAHERTDGIHLT